MDILFEDNHCLAVNKPAPLLTQAPPGIPSLEAMARDYLRTKYQKTGRIFLGVPQRLDRPVTGVVLFAKQSKSAQRLAEQFEKRQVAKIYWGVIEGTLAEAEGVWEDWLRKVQDQARAEAVGAEAEGARHAVLHYRRLADCAGGPVLEFTPQTGRMHQIRVQCSRRGYPIHGDVDYGARLPFGPPALEPRDRVIALHARSLTFLHPIRYEPVIVTAPLPATWEALPFSPGS